jgi:predicted transglutaminase-like cysteine proteinase
MWLSSHGRIAARILVAFGVFAGGGAAARTAPQVDAVVTAPGSVQPLAIGLGNSMSKVVPAPMEDGPFGLTASHHSGLATRWLRLQPVIRVEAAVLALCRSQPTTCTPAAARFLSIVDAARAHTGLARIGTINRAVNLAIRPMSDQDQFGVADVWATPLMTFANGTGDCEDYAIAKYVALRQAGMAARDLRLVILHNRLANEDHAITAARLHGRWLILDNQRMALLTDSEMRNMTPLLALDSAPDTASPAMTSMLSLPVAAIAKPRPTENGPSGASIIMSDVFFTNPAKTTPGLPLALAA